MKTALRGKISGIQKYRESAYQTYSSVRVRFEPHPKGTIWQGETE